MRNDQPLPRVD